MVGNLVDAVVGGLNEVSIACELVGNFVVDVDVDVDVAIIGLYEDLIAWDVVGPVFAVVVGWIMVVFD